MRQSFWKLRSARLLGLLGLATIMVGGGDVFAPKPGPFQSGHCGHVGWMSLCCGGSHRHCSIFSSVPGLHPVGAGRTSWSTLTPQNVPRPGTMALIETCWSGWEPNRPVLFLPEATVGSAMGMQVVRDQDPDCHPGAISPPWGRKF